METTKTVNQKLVFSEYPARAFDIGDVVQYRYPYKYNDLYFIVVAIKTDGIYIVQNTGNKRFTGCEKRAKPDHLFRFIKHYSFQEVELKTTIK